MPTLNEVYRKFGETAEAAQLLETELNNLLSWDCAVEESLLSEPNPTRAAELFGKIDRHTLGQLIKRLNYKTKSLDQLESLLSCALDERNRLFHSFYRQHNFRRNSNEGRAVMLKDLDSIHCILLDAYKAALLLSGIDIEAIGGELKRPIRHLPI
jgi:hypothetical protein